MGSIYDCRGRPNVEVKSISIKFKPVSELNEQQFSLIIYLFEVI